MAVLGVGTGFRDIRQWYSKIAVLERCVCLLTFKSQNGNNVGTGFLIGPDLILTATHNGGSPHSEITALFDYAVNERGEINPGSTYPLFGDPIAASPPGEFDTMLLRLKDPVGDQEAGHGVQRGWIDLGDGNLDPRPGSPIAVFQHAEGGPLKVSMNTDGIAHLSPDGRRLFHRTDTLPGSSGAPCFDNDWRLVAMHHARSLQLNEGIPVSRIRRWLEEIGHWDAVNVAPPKSSPIAIGQIGLPKKSAFPLDTEIKALLAAGESQHLELKARALDASAERPRISRRLLIAVAAFMNSRDGGTIMIGVNDDLTISGLEEDYPRANPQQANWDGFQKWLSSVIHSHLQTTTPLDFISLVRYQEEGKEICAVQVRPAKSPVFVDDKFHVRAGAMNIPYAGPNLIEYCKGRWP
jgi:hypothetical protein